MHPPPQNPSDSHKVGSEKYILRRQIIGTTLNYGYQRECLIIKVLVDMDNKCMTITSKMHPNGEKFQNIIGPVFPAFQNKNTHKGSGCKLLIQYQQL